MTEQELIDIFTKLGAPDPEWWAKSHLRDGFQLTEFLLLRGLWKTAFSAESTEWIDSFLKTAPEDELSSLMKEVLNAGITKKQLAKLSRLMQAESLVQVAQILDDASAVQEDFCRLTGKEYVEWGVFMIDKESMEATGPSLGCLDDNFFSLDPEKPANSKF